MLPAAACVSVRGRTRTVMREEQEADDQEADAHDVGAAQLAHATDDVKAAEGTQELQPPQSLEHRRVGAGRARDRRCDRLERECAQKVDRHLTAYVHTRRRASSLLCAVARVRTGAELHENGEHEGCIEETFKRLLALISRARKGDEKW